MDNRIIGSTILSLYIDEEKEYLVFSTNKGEFCYWAEYDCCNDVWFNHIDNVDALIGGTVADIQESGWTETEPPTTQDYDDIAFWTFITNKGYCKIEVRNSSNGYYGGNVRYLDNIPDKLTFVSLSKDF